MFFESFPVAWTRCPGHPVVTLRHGKLAAGGGERWSALWGVAEAILLQKGAEYNGARLRAK